MPPKNGGSAGGGANPNVERLNQLAVSSFTSADAFRFFVSKVPALKPYDQPWTDSGPSGRDLCLIDPFNFVSV
jgi:hypothetical protein